MRSLEMLTVEDYEKIRKAVLVEGLSERQAARKFHHSCKTIKKALTHSVPPGYKKRSSPAGAVVLTERLRFVIDTLLEKNKTIRRKQKMTGTKIHDILVSDYEFCGCAQTVRRYIATKKLQAKEVFFKLEFQPGQEGQVDWGEADVIINGKDTKVHLFCLRLAYSRASFVRAYPSQKMECFLDGHVHAFDFFGGVARSNAYDNLKSAVIQVGKGKERKLNSKFIELRSHYLFNSRFCNIASGNEKGHAENLVKDSQRDLMSPPPHVVDIDELNELLLRQCTKRLDIVVKDKGKTRGQLLEEERQFFLPLPKHQYNACVGGSTYATKQALVEHDNNFYSVPTQWAHHDITIKAFVSRVELYHDDNLVASHERCWDSSKYILNYMHYIPLLKTKPGGIHNAAAFIGQPWGSDFEKLKIELEYRYDGEGTKKFINVLLLFCEYEASQVKAAVKTCISRRAFNDEAVRNILEYQPDAIRKSIDLTHKPELQIKTNGIRQASEYDEFLLTNFKTTNEGSVQYGKQYIA